MASNTIPIYPLTPNIGFGKVSAANTALDGTGTVVTCFTAGANGARVDSITVWSMGTNVASALRIFINNGLDQTNAANSALYWDTAMTSDTVSQTGAQNNYFVPAGMVLPAGYKINAAVGTVIAAGAMVVVTGGNF